ncbi:Uncharacterised protein [uncultured archaeon]|nr:Uncharacterised protein [uncultured archaeon]
MSKATPDYARYAYAYVPTIEHKEKWEKLAKKSKTSLSKFIFEHVENSLHQEEDEDYKPRAEILDNLHMIVKENDELREDLRMKKLVIEKLESELHRYRSEEFINSSHSGVRKYNIELIELLKKRGSVTNEEILRALGINPTDGDNVKAISAQLDNLHSYGLVAPTSRGWSWLG